MSGGSEARLAGRTVLISGAARGMGEAEARLFAECGADVVLGDIDPGDTAKIAEDIGPRAVACRLDVREERDWERAVALAVERFGRPVTGMVNNAAVGGDGRPLTRTSLETYLNVVTTNQVGTFLGLKVCGGHMAEHGGGAMVTVSSVMGLAGHRNVAPYVSSKFAVRGLTRVAALELAARGVRVNCIIPGTVDTRMLRGKERDPRVLEQLAAQVPQNEIAEPVEIARAALFLISDESRYVNGTDLVVDGAMMAAIPFTLG
ncbi:MAG TPA: SDR family NAD(P)-dependent oxidoreductase [Pseudonocardia sp.]|jgi:3alpha(or 20beta)-hydroxysteroid dehydrogenase